VVNCEALTVRGVPCRAHAVVGAARCWAHGGRRGPAEDDLVATMVEAAREDWRAAAWILERRFPRRWRRGVVEEREPAAPGADVLDELAGRRSARRAER
jgi:hypothetical protein